MRTYWCIAVLCALALLPRLLFVMGWHENFDADEALLGLQAREFVQGHFPVFFSGQSYMGSLQALVAAPLLAAFGNHPVALRLSPLLWLLPGLMALLRLERLGHGLLARGRGAWWLAVCWCFPPVTLALASVKARGGGLEVLVLGLWSLLLVWPRAEQSLCRQLGRFTGAGVLLGLALWTQVQAALFFPLVGAALCFSSRPRALLLAALAGGALVGYLPIWLPRVAPLLVGPPGVEGTLYRPAIEHLLEPAVLTRMWWILLGTVTARRSLSANEALPEMLYALLIVLLLIVTIGGLVRVARTQSRPHRLATLHRSILSAPTLVVTAWLALASVVTIAATPVLFEDGQWYRFLTPVAPFLVILQAHALMRLPVPLGCAAAVILGFSASSVLLRTDMMWANTRLPDPPALVRSLEEQGVNRVVSQWWVAYPLRFWSGDRILATARGVPRYPEIAASVEFASRAWRVATTPQGGQSRAGSPEQSLHLVPRREDPPSEAVAAFCGLDLQRTLFPQYEPYPLLSAGGYRRDWRGWPPRRGLHLFNHVVWIPSLAPREGLRDSIESAIMELERAGELQQVAHWGSRRILSRPSGRER